MSQTNQIILDKEGLSSIIAQHFAAKFPEGLVINVHVMYFGRPPKEVRRSNSQPSRTNVADRYLNKTPEPPPKETDPPFLSEVGAIVTLDPQPKKE